MNNVSGGTQDGESKIMESWTKPQKVGESGREKREKAQGKEQETVRNVADINSAVTGGRWGRLSQLQDMPAETSKPEKQREKRQRQEKTNQNIQGPWDNYKEVTHTMGMPGRKRGDKGIDICEAIVNDDFPKLKSDTKPEIQEVQRMPSRINAPKSHVRTKKNSWQRQRKNTLCTEEQSKNYIQRLLREHTRRERTETPEVLGEN